MDPSNNVTVAPTSAVPVKTGEKVTETIKRYNKPRVDFDVVSNPEFLREGFAVADLMNPDRVVIGVRSQRPVAAMKEIYAPFNAPIIVTDINSAELIKHASNSFLAMKVSYFNEVYDLCQRMGIEYDVVRDLVVADRRSGPSHSDVFDCGYRGYSGKCLPKDSKALIDLAKSESVSMLVLQATDAVNAELIARQRSAAALRGIAAVEVDAADDDAQERRAA